MNKLRFYLNNLDGFGRIWFLFCLGTFLFAAGYGFNNASKRLQDWDRIFSTWEITSDYRNPNCERYIMGDLQTQPAPAYDASCYHLYSYLNIYKDKAAKSEDDFFQKRFLNYWTSTIPENVGISLFFWLIIIGGLKIIASLVKWVIRGFRA